MSLEQVNGDGFRFYRWDPEDGTEPSDLLSVTTIRSLCGESFNLVNWKLGNIADAALGTMKRTVVGPRGGIKEVRQVWEYPSEFARRYDECALSDDDPEAAKAQQGRIDALRKWLRERADEPRNVAAARGTMVHEAIEHNVAWDRIERPYVESAFASLSGRDRARVKRAINDEDVSFVRNSVRQYWDMRSAVPMSILAREVQVVNLTAGYAGTFDALVWLFGAFEDGEFIPLPPEAMAKAKALRGDRAAIGNIKTIGGTIALLDWKTSAGIYTDQAVQAHAYLAAEFAVVNGRVDPRVTSLLNAALVGGLVHIRPNGWGLHLFPFREEAVRAFLGSVAFARFLAKYPEPDKMFTHTFKGVAEDVDD